MSQNIRKQITLAPLIVAVDMGSKTTAHSIKPKTAMQPIQTLLTDALPSNDKGTVGQSETLFGNDTFVDVVIDKIDRPQAKGLRSKGSAKGSGLEFAQKKAAEALTRRQAGNSDQAILQVMLPLWDDDRRGVPNPLIRSGLFSVRSTPKRHQFLDEKIASLSNIDVFYKGEELRQDDLSVWIALMTKARKQLLDAPIYFTGYELVKDLGWRMHSESYARAKACIDRLKFTSLKIASSNMKAMYAGSLIRDFAYDAMDEKGNAKWMVRLESKVAQMFLNENTTFLEWEQRKAIGPRASLTLWLHAFFSSHRDPLPIPVSKVHELCKSEQQSMANFKIRVRQSLETLVVIGFLVDYKVTNDMVKVDKSNARTRLN